MKSFKNQNCKTILLTGAGGFIGHHCVEYWLKHTDWNLLLLDSFRHYGTFSRLYCAINEVQLTCNERIEILLHDLTCPLDDVLIRKLLQISSGKIDVIVNMASNSAVGRSLTNPRECWENNCDIAINMLEFARLGIKRVPSCGGFLNTPLFIQISTDEVYGDCILELHHEWDTIRPSNPYSASKAAQEALCFSYWRSYQMPMVIVNTMNNFGERQDPEKFIPRLIGQISRDEEVQIFTDANGIIGSRCYLHCKDHAAALHSLVASGIGYQKFNNVLDRPERFNICGSSGYDNLEIAKLVASMMKKQLKYRLVKPQDVRPGYDGRYGLTPGYMSATTGWSPPPTIIARLQETIDWTLANPEWIG